MKTKRSDKRSMTTTLKLASDRRETVAARAGHPPPAKRASAPKVIRFSVPGRALSVEVSGDIKNINPVRRALFERLAGAVAKRIEDVPQAQALEMLKQGTDAEAMVSFATMSALFPEAAAVEFDPLAKARVRGTSLRSQILERDDMLSLAEAAQALRLTPPAVNDRLHAGRLFALEGAVRGRRYPGWQFEDGVAGKALESVLAALRGADPWSIYRFFTTPDSALNDRVPLEVLRSGDVASVVQAAQRFARGEQGGN